MQMHLIEYGMASYSVSYQDDEISEGQVLKFFITTTGLNAGTQIYWKLSGVNITSSDMQSGTFSSVGIEMLKRSEVPA